MAPVQGSSHYAAVFNSTFVDMRLCREVTCNTIQICLYIEIILSDNSHPLSNVNSSLDGGQRIDCRQSSLLYVGVSAYLIKVLELPVFVGPCHHGMARPQVAVGGTASDMEGNCEYIE